MIFSEVRREYLRSFLGGTRVLRNETRAYLRDVVRSAILREDEGADLAKSLYTLAKYSDGHWKSDKQARFLQSRLAHKHSKYVATWMQRFGYKGKGFVHISKIPGTGTKDVSKARYAAKLFIWDTGGVSHVIRMKYVHPKKGEVGFHLDWNDKGKVTWKRSKDPVVHVDVDKENLAKALANAPMIAKLKSIPDWESNNLLMSFLKQLEAGRKLSFKQLNIVNKLLPGEKEDLGQEEWAAQVPRFRKVIASFIRSYLDKLKAAEIQTAQKWIANKTANTFLLHTPSGEDQKNLQTAEVADVEPYYEKKFSKYLAAVRAFEQTGEYTPFEDEWSWAWNGGMNELIDAQKLNYLSGGDDPRELFTQIAKKAMGKKPTKKSLNYIQFMLRAVKSKGAPGYPV